jgi:hypothetical protein
MNRLLAFVRERLTGNTEQLQELTEKVAKKYFCGVGLIWRSQMRLKKGTAQSAVFRHA